MKITVPTDNAPCPESFGGTAYVSCACWDAWGYRRRSAITSPENSFGDNCEIVDTFTWQGAIDPKLMKCMKKNSFIIIVTLPSV